MWLSLMKPITLRPVSCSISRLTSFFMIICQRWRRSSTASLWPALASVCSPRVSVSCEHHEHAVGAERGLCPRGATTGRPRQRPNDSVRDLGGEFPVGDRAFGAHRGPPLSANGVPAARSLEQGRARQRTTRPASGRPKIVRVTSPRRRERVYSWRGTRTPCGGVCVSHRDSTRVCRSS